MEAALTPAKEFETWPVDRAGFAVVSADGILGLEGDSGVFELASIAKLFAAMTAMMVAAASAPPPSRDHLRRRDTGRATERVPVSRVALVATWGVRSLSGTGRRVEGWFSSSSSQYMSATSPSGSSSPGIFGRPSPTCVAARSSSAVTPS